jgi:KDO2-lipid IV(A) lauroyltransferase
VAFLFNLLPEFIYKFFANFLAFLWVDVFQIRKAVVFKNINTAFPNTDLATQTKWMRFSIYVLAKNLFDLFRVPFITDQWLEKNVVFRGFENLKDVPDGCFFLSLHMASGDLAAAVVSHKIKPLSLITKRFSNQVMDEFWFSIRQRSKTQFIDAHGRSNAFEILKALRAGRGVVFVLDQFMGKPYGIETQFFNQKTGTAYGLALFAQKTQKPVLPLYSYWDESGKLNVCLKPIVDLSSLITDDIDTNNKAITNQFNREIEEIIKAHPEHWLWVHKRWKVFE